MKKYLIEYKPFLVFIATFFITYILFTVIYKLYLDRFDKNDIDGITNVVGHNVDQLMCLFNLDVKIFKNISYSFVEVWYNKRYILRIVEGCNAVSVIILFVSFVVAFSGKLKTTILFVSFGVLLIHVLNVIRIAFLSILLFHFPEKEHLLHGVLFPVIIYGFVFILWIVWVNKFSKYAK